MVEGRLGGVVGMREAVVLLAEAAALELLLEGVIHVDMLMIN